MHKIPYISAGLLLLLIACNSKPAVPKRQSSGGIDSISLFLEKADSIGDADSALVWANKAHYISTEINDQRWIAKTQLVFSRIYRSKHDEARGRDSLEKAIPVLEKIGRKSDKGDALIEQAHYFDNAEYTDSNIRTEIRMIEQAGQLFNQAGDSIKYATALCTMGMLYGTMGIDSTSRTMDTLKKSLAIYKGRDGCQYVYDAMGQQYAKDGSWPQAIGFAIQAVNAAEKYNDTGVDITTLYNNLGSYYYNAKQFNQSYPYFEKALIITKNNCDTMGVIDLVHSLVSAYYQCKEYKQAIALLEETEKTYKVSNTDALIQLSGIALTCYSATGEYKLAKPHLAKLLQYSAKLDKLDKSQSYVYTYLIAYYLNIKQYKEAEKYSIINDTFTRYYRLPRVIASNYEWWSIADSGLKHFEAAYNHFRQATKIKDTLFNGESRKQLTELKVKYETEKKEQNIALLTKQSRLQQITLKNAQLTKNVMFGAAGMLTIVLGLGYNRYRLKQRNNKRLELKQQEINEKNERLQQLLKEKEWLIKEIHHRVKNNLQIVMSLLNSQSMYLNNEAAVKAITESQSRMHAMSLIHQKLYQSDNVSTVSMQSYIRELISYLRDSYETRMCIVFEEGPDIDLDVAQAIPVGLILNEAITNAIKYAFPNGGTGTINVLIEKREPDNIYLCISDNGVGLPDEYDIAQSTSLGMSLMKGLTQQLGGNFIIKNEKGLIIEITFPYFKEVYSV